jgi:hypothetical protein
MARIRGRNRIKRQGADRAGALPVIRVAGAERLNIQGHGPV